MECILLMFEEKGIDLRLYAINSLESKTKLHCLAREPFYVCCHSVIWSSNMLLIVCFVARKHCYIAGKYWTIGRGVGPPPSRCRSLQRCRYDGLHLNDDPVPAPRGVVDGGEFATQLPVQTHSISLRQVGAGPARLDWSRLWFPASNISTKIPRQTECSFSYL